MQHRMREFEMAARDVENLLNTTHAGHISTNGIDGYPYTVSVHYIYFDQKIYFHGLPTGEKIENLQRDCKVCFEVSRLDKILLPADNNDVCTADARYESAVIRGRAKVLDDLQLKEEILKKIVEKYVPSHIGAPMPINMIKGTAVVEITVDTITGKYHK